MKQRVFGLRASIPCGKPMVRPHQRQEAKRRIKARKESLGEIARSYNVSRCTIQRLSV